MNTKTQILYIDDEPINLELFMYNFEDNYNVITACSGEKGLEYLLKYPNIKVVISDMKMPKMNGLEFISKAKETYSDKKYFILTGFNITSEMKWAIESKLILKYFRKPFNINEIRTSIEEVI